MGLADLKDGEKFLDFKEHVLELEIAPERTCTLITRMVGLKALCKSPYNHCLSTEEVCANMSGDSSCLSQQQYICWYYWVVTTHLNLKFYQIDIYNSFDVSSAIEDILVLMVQARAIVP